MNNNLATTNQNAKLALTKSKNLLNITKSLLSNQQSSHYADDSWIEKLFKWADEKYIPNYEWVQDKDNEEEGYYNGIPRDAKTLFKLKTLKLYNLDFEQLPNEFFNLIQLEKLTINNSNLKKLSNKIKNLKNLRDLSLVKNQLSELPNELQHLTKLTDIHLHTNNFKVFPEVLHSIKSLIHICIYQNKIKYIPKEINQLKDLDLLTIDNNMITDLPIELFELKKLKTLAIFDNKITMIPSEIKYLININLLVLGDNNIMDTLPDEICNLGISNTLYLKNMSRLVLTEKQKEWISDLEKNGCTVYTDDDLFSRGIPEIDIDDEIPF